MVDNLISFPAEAPSMHIKVPIRTDWDTAVLFLHMSRDHGIPSYTNMLQYCTNSTFAKKLTFEEMKSNIEPQHIKLLKYIYAIPEDVDLLVGLLLEAPIPGAVVGPTLNCLLKEQFILLKESDRFWYENDLPPSSFSSDQIREIKKITLAGWFVPQLFTPKIKQ